MPNVNFLLYRLQSGDDGDWAVIAKEDASDPSVALENGDYYVIGGDTVATGSATVADLTVSIAGDTAVGSTLTATTNGSGTVTYQWQADSVNIAGATSSTYDTSSRSAGEDITCDVADGIQTASSTAITLTAPASFTSYAATPDGGDWFDLSATPGVGVNTTNSRDMIVATVITVPTAGSENKLFSTTDTATSVGVGLSNTNAMKTWLLSPDLAYSTSPSASTTLTATNTVALVWLLKADSTSTRIQCAYKVGSGSPTLDFNATRAASALFLTGTSTDVGTSKTAAFTLFSARADGTSNSSNFKIPNYGVRVFTYADGTLSLDLSTSDLTTVFNTLFASDVSGGSPWLTPANVGGAAAKIDTTGLTVAQLNTGSNNGSLGNFASVTGALA